MCSFQDAEVSQLDEVIGNLKAEIELAQDYINDCQNSIMQMEESSKVNVNNFCQKCGKCPT